MDKNERALAKRTKLILSFLKKINNQRPVLKYVDVQKCGGKDFMVFTDSHVAFWLKDDIAELPHCKEANVGNYPNMERLYFSWSDKLEEKLSVRYLINVEKLKLSIKNKEEFVRVGDTALDAKLFKTLLDIMDTNAITITFSKFGDGLSGSANVFNNLGYGLLLGVRPNVIENAISLTNVEE